MINRTDFIEPTPKYTMEFEDKSPDDTKDWFNIDLIWIAKQYEEKHNDPEFHQAYNKWIQEFEVNMTIEEIYERYKDYPNNDFKELMKVLIRN
jgi:hypothetical protein